MKEKIINFTFTLFCIISFIFLLFYNKEVAEIILSSVDLFFKKVFVSLFPMFILQDLFIALNIPYYFYKIFQPIFKKIFKTSGICAYVFFMSLISGTPSNAYILKELLSLNKITIEEANHALYFTYFSNPLFLLTMLSFLFDRKKVITIILIHYFANLIIAFLLRKKAPLMNTLTFSKDHFSLAKTLSKSIKKSMNTLLMILGTITFYMLLTFIISNLFPMSPLFKTITSGFLELTSGLQCLTTLVLKNKIKESIAIAIISFGGLSIHTQILTILEGTPLKYTNFLKGRILQTFISVTLILFI